MIIKCTIFYFLLFDDFNIKFYFTHFIIIFLTFTRFSSVLNIYHVVESYKIKEFKNLIIETEQAKQKIYFV